MDGSPASCASCREPMASGADEPAYQSDLRSLLEQARTPTRAAQDEEESCVEIPPSVREAIRNAEAPLFSEQVLAASTAAGTAPRRPRLKLAALPVIALALIGVVIGSAQGSRLDQAALAPTPPPVTRAADAPPAIVEAVAPPQQPATTLSTRPTAQAAVAHPANAAPSARPSPARPPPAVAARPRPTASAAPAPSPAPAPDPPSLMQAITNAVRSGPSPADHR